MGGHLEGRAEDFAFLGAPPLQNVRSPVKEGKYKATWKREFKVPWREAGPPNHLDDKVDSNQKVVDTELSLWVPR